MASLIRNLIDNITESSIENSTSDMYNDTFFTELPKWSSTEPLMKKFHDVLIVILLICVMFAMGCSITLEQVWGHIKRPIGVLIGMLSQFILLPFAAFCLIIVLDFDPLHSAGMIVLACSPGGVTSNIFTYFCDGDLSLSVTMTSISTLVALVMMPFNVWMYGRTLETETLIIPYNKMSLSLLFLTMPVAAGMLFNSKFPKFAPFLTKVGTVAGFGIIIVCQTLEVFIFPDIFIDVPLKLYVGEFLLPILGLALGFITSSLFRLKYSIRRTIAIECGIQNVGTALTIVSLSFPFDQLRKVWLFPFLYAFTMLAVCIVTAFVYQMGKRIFAKSLDINQNTIEKAQNCKIPGIEIFDQETELTEELLKKQNVMPQIIPSKFNL